MHIAERFVLALVYRYRRTETKYLQVSFLYTTLRNTPFYRMDNTTRSYQTSCKFLRVTNVIAAFRLCVRELALVLSMEICKANCSENVLTMN